MDFDSPESFTDQLKWVGFRQKVLVLNIEIAGVYRKVSKLHPIVVFLIDIQLKFFRMGDESGTYPRLTKTCLNAELGRLGLLSADDQPG
jgi:hypothetical protein